MSSEGADKFREMTRQAASYPLDDPRRQITIVLDGEVVSAPYVHESVDPDVGMEGGIAIITMGTGENQQQAAQDLAAVLRHGALPVIFEIVNVSLLD
jgi:preprotein translocase subunit SecD